MFNRGVSCSLAIALMVILVVNVDVDCCIFFKTQMVPKLYKTNTSPAVRSVYMTANALGITLEYEEVEEHLKPELMKLNPQQAVPILIDDGNIIWDSHAINIYLVSKFAQNDSLYPKDHYTRAIIDQRLHFDSGVLFPLYRFIVKPILCKGVKTISKDLIQEANQAYAFLEKFLVGHQWAVGNNITLADFSLLSSITTLDVLVPINPGKNRNIVEWIKRAERLPYYSFNQKGLEDFKMKIEKLLS